jgi:hypothetical protein
MLTRGLAVGVKITSASATYWESGEIAEVQIAGKLMPCLLKQNWALSLCFYRYIRTVQVETE